MINTIDLTISGMPVIFYRLPNGDFKDLKFKYDGETYYESWKKYDKPIFTTINLINIESFKQLSYPIVDIKIVVVFLKDIHYRAFRNVWIFSCSLSLPVFICKLFKCNSFTNSFHSQKMIKQFL